MDNGRTHFIRAISGIVELDCCSINDQDYVTYRRISSYGVLYPILF